MKLKISIVIPTRNRALSLERCLKSFFSQTRLPEEIIVVDNYSYDSTPLVVKRLKKNLPIRYCWEKKVSPSAARNRGIKLSRGEIVALLDDDCVPTPNWVANIYLAHRRKSNIFLQGRSINIIQSPSFFNILYYFHMERTLRFKIYSSLEKEKEGLVRFVDTKNLSFPRKLLVENKLFLDESLPIYVEDADLAIRILNLGIPIYYDPQIIVHHFIERPPEKFIRDRLIAGWALFCLESKWGFQEKRQRWSKFSSIWKTRRRKFLEEIEANLLKETLVKKNFFFRLFFNLERKGEKLLLPILLNFAYLRRFFNNYYQTAIFPVKKMFIKINNWSKKNLS